MMKDVRGGVIAKLRQKQPKIIDIHCICHIVVKLAVQTLPLKIDEFLVDVIIYNSTKCVSTLQEYADFCNVEFKHCETLRLSVTRALERTLDMWDPLVSYFSHPDSEKKRARSDI